MLKINLQLFVLIIIQLLDLKDGSLWPEAYLIQRLLFIIVHNFGPCLQNLILVGTGFNSFKFAFLLILQLVDEIVNYLQFVTFEEPSLDSFSACWHSKHNFCSIWVIFNRLLW